MPSKNSFSSSATLSAAGKTYSYFDLNVAARNGLGDISRLPVSLKVLLENLLRTEDGVAVKKPDIAAIAGWLKNRGKDEVEIAFSPARVLMQDFTGVPAVVDLAAMRDAAATLGADPERINPLVPVDLVIDHSVMVDHFASSYQPKSPDKALRLPPGRLALNIPNGTVIVGSDVHLWPGDLTTAQRAFIRYCKELKPDVVVMNGDVFDGARISRHPAGMWSQEVRPNVKQELEACDTFLTEVYKASTNAKHYWTFGNHDARLEARLAAMVPEYEGVPGFALKDHFPEWKMGMSLWINDDVVIKHRYHNGIHAVYNNALKGGKSIVTGHLHSLKVMPWTDYNGNRYGVDCGTLSDASGNQFDYLEDNPVNWRSGFAVLTFHKGRLLMPELAQVCGEDEVEFRGQVWKV